MIRTAYLRYLGDRPESMNIAAAQLGFDELGIRTVPFQGFGDIETEVDCGPEALVCGLIEDVYKALDKLGLFSEPVNFVSEYRCYVLDGQIAGVRFYKGDWSKAPTRQVVEAAVKAYAPYRAYAIDFGVLEDGRTAVVEVNDSFALGSYGLQPVRYARMIEARWEELTASLLGVRADA